MYFLVLALAAILSSGAERFEQFGRRPLKEQSFVEVGQGVMEEMMFGLYFFIYISVALATILCTEVERFVQLL